MSDKISTFNEGLNYLDQIKKEDRSSSFVPMLLRLLMAMGAAGKLVNKKVKENVHVSKEIFADTSRKLRSSPLRFLVFVACIAFITGIISREVLARRQKTKKS